MSLTKTPITFSIIFVTLALMPVVAIASNGDSSQPSVTSKQPVALSAKEKAHIQLLPCELDSNRTLTNVEDEAKRNSNFFGTKTVPKDLEIDPIPMHIAIINPTSVYSLPDTNTPSYWGPKPPLQMHANCRVKDPHGDWWYASRDAGGNLTYIPDANAMPQKDYEELIREENVRWKKEHQ